MVGAILVLPAAVFHHSPYGDVFQTIPENGQIGKKNGSMSCHASRRSFHH
ncbi:hypothetical protein [Geobacillus subterraneus]|nr:hypothetical protein [Geobacillus subterraneus]